MSVPPRSRVSRGPVGANRPPAAAAPAEAPRDDAADTASTPEPDSLLPRPAAALEKLLEEAAHPKMNARLLVKLMGSQRGPAALLRTSAESALLGRGKPVTSTLDACLALGRRGVSALLTTWAVRQLTPRLPVAEPYLDLHWEQATRRGAMALVLARHLNFDSPEQAFCAAFLSDAALPYLLAKHPEQVDAYQHIATSPAPRRLQSEQDLFGTTHSQAIASVTAAWCIPAELATTIRASHSQDPVLQGQRLDRLILLVCAAEHCADVFVSQGHPESVVTARAALQRATFRAPLGLPELASEAERIAPVLADMFRVPFQTRPEIFVDLTSDNTVSRSPGADPLVQAKRALRKARKERDELTQVLRRMTTELQSTSSLDELTLTATRSAFLDTLSAELERARDKSWPLCLLLVGVDRMARLNKRHGTLAGDEALKQIVQVFREVARPTDVIGRLYGDVFAIALPRTPVDGGLVAARRLRQAVQDRTLDVNPRAERLTVSVGGKAFRPEAPVGVTIDTLLGGAESAMLTAKARDGNLVLWHRS